jgi:hypothetical protein
MDGLSGRNGLLDMVEGRGVYIIWDSSFGHDRGKGGINCILLGQTGCVGM